MELILVARRSNGQLIVLHDRWTRDELKKLRQLEQFICPQCNGFLRLKVGAINIPHFAHYNDESCEQYFSEGETYEHLQGKLDLYHFFQAYPSLEIQLEPYLPKLKQRPDLLIRQKSRLMPIEFQVSRISRAQMEERTYGYEAHSLEPLWILHTPSKIIALTKGPAIYSLNSFEYQFLIDLEQGYLFTYNPKTKTFHYISNLMHIENNKYIVNHRTLSIANQQYPFATPKALSTEEVQQYLALFQQEREKYIQSVLFYNRKGINNVFLRSCYEMRIVPSLLPKWIGVPIAFDDGFAVHSCEWQMAFVHYLGDAPFALQLGDQSLYEQFLNQYYRVNTCALFAIETYHSFLVEIGYDHHARTVQVTEQNKYSVILSEYLQKGRGIEKI